MWAKVRLAIHGNDIALPTDTQLRRAGGGAISLGEVSAKDSLVVRGSAESNSQHYFACPSTTKIIHLTYQLFVVQYICGAIVGARLPAPPTVVIAFMCSPAFNIGTPMGSF
jgi:hypothetical protein